MIKIFTLCILICITLQIGAQEKTVFGKITAFVTIPIQNVKIIAKKSGKETITDENGLYRIICLPNDQLIIQANGFVGVRQKVDNLKDSLNVNLYFSNSLKNSTLAVSAGHIDAITLENAIQNMPNPKEDYSKFLDINHLIKTKFPFVQINNGNYVIPPVGFSNSEALLILNGAEVRDISFVQPREVKSIKVLKGPDATIYGIRGGNGVIEITTWISN